MTNIWQKWQTFIETKMNLPKISFKYVHMLEWEFYSVAGPGKTAIERLEQRSSWIFISTIKEHLDLGTAASVCGLSYTVHA